MRFRFPLTLAVLLATPLTLHAESEVTLRGSPAAMQQQNRIAKEEGLTFYRTGAQIRKAAESGELVELTSNEDYEVADFVSYPYANPVVELFASRLGRQYRAACGQKLVVTSATRPINGQPANAHALSVHPVGLALDLRVSDRADCRRWLEDALLGMEANGLLNATREYHPPHYHVAIFPSQYLAYAEARMAEEAAARAEEERRALELLAARSQPLVTASVAKKVDVEQDEGRDPLVLLLATAGVGAFVGGRRALRRLKG